MRNFHQLSILRSFTYWKFASNNSKYVFCRRVLLSNHSKVHREFWVTGSAGVPSHGFCSHPTSPTAGVGGSKSKSELQRGPIPTRSILPLKKSSGELTWATEFRWDHSFPAENASTNGTKIHWCLANDCFLGSTAYSIFSSNCIGVETRVCFP